MAEILEVYDHLDSAFANLALQIFYTSKNRVLGEEYYMPWISKYPTNEIINIVLKVDQKVIGGLAVVVQPIHRYDGIFRIGLVGLVCIEANSRGHGYFKILMNKLCEVAVSSKLDLLTLWTSQHHFYQPYGFSIDDPLVSFLIDTKGGERKNIIHYITEIESNYMSVPGSSLSCQKISFGMNSITVVDYENGRTLVKWSGSVDDVFDFVMGYFLKDVTLILPSDDEFVKICLNKSSTTGFRHLNHQMWALINKELMPCSAKIISQFKFLILDRI